LKSYFAIAIVRFILIGGNMKTLLAVLIALAAPSAFAWNAAAIGYMQPQQAYQQPAQASYSEQYNQGYVDAYNTANGYPQSNGYGTAYQQGQNDAYRAARGGY
jgi:hypothetical protein